MSKDKIVVKSYKEGRRKLYELIESLLQDEDTLSLYFEKREDLKVNIIFRNGNALVKGDDTFKAILNRVDFDKSYNAKADKYKARFKSAYNQCKEAIESKGNVSLNTAVIGVIGPTYDPERYSNGYVIYDNIFFKLDDLLKLSKEQFKGLNSDNELIAINDTFKYLYDLKIDSDKDKEDEDLDKNKESNNIYSKNKILFGPPGTGKSYNIKEKMNIINVKNENTIRVTFYPEYSYYEFIGQYKPVVGYETVASSIKYPNTEGASNEKAFVYYDFVPGPFAKAIIKALKLKETSENALLIIEEINRGNSTAIFGDIFQLLDRINDVNNKYYGESEYSIDIQIEMKEYIKKKLNWEEEDWNENFPRGFVIPKNLYIYATMNTSDQSLYPVDSAFKRRWDMEYMYIDYNEPKLQDLYLPEPYTNIKWLDFIKVINKEIVNYTEVDDKQIGQWFVGHNLTESEFLGKVISYLWFDVFRYNPEIIFKEEIKTFDDVRNYYSEGVFKVDIIESIENKSVSEDEES